MVSYGQMMHPLSVYQKNHTANLPYSTAYGWYPNHHPNNQYISGSAPPSSTTPLSSAGSIGLDDSVAASSMYYNHHHMFHQPSPDWSGHDNFALAAQNSSILQSAMGPSSAALHLSQSLNSGLNGSHGNGVENLSNPMQNIPPSPPITVNSGCSDMSSPGITNSGASNIGNGGTSPHMGSANSSNSRPKSPYEWMKKPSYQSQPNPG